jgi:aminoglycoside phosphotransferase (APT) family kinase protein
VTTAQTEVDALRDACIAVRLRSNDVTLLHKHATSVWLLRDVGVVARISFASEDRSRIARAVAVTRWLDQQGFPAVQPMDVDQPLDVGQMSVTFWRYYPQGGKSAPGAAHLGRLLKDLHRLPSPPVDLHPYQPLSHLGLSLESDVRLSADDTAWLAQRRVELLDEYAAIDTSLGVGFIHGDAYPGNTLWDGDGVRLSDWDEIAIGPRELDLVNTHQGARVGRSKEERDAFTKAYGWDVTAWPGFAVLREMRDLHTLAAYIDRASTGDEAAAAELRHRVATIKSGDTSARWHVG